MRKQVVTLGLLLFVMTGLLSGCNKPSEELILGVCGSYGVPGMMLSDMKGQVYQCQVVERDSQGRVLFHYTTENWITGKNETAYVICQQSEEDAVWYYEDICYCFAPVSEAQLLELKTANHWGEPLNREIMTHRPVKVTLDMYPGYTGC